MLTTLKRVIKAIINTIILSGIIHLTVLALHSIINRSIDHLNAFEILSLDIFFPHLVGGPEKILASWVLVGVIIAFFYQIQNDK